MATDPILNFEQLNMPVSGEDGSEDALRSAVRAARDDCRRAEDRCIEFRDLGPEFEGQPPPDQPDWGRLVDSATEILATKSKDLWIAAWLTEALTRTHGFAGLRDGFRASRELAENFWNSIRPQPDEEDGVVNTVIMIDNLNGDVLVDPINAIALTSHSESLRAVTSGTFRQTPEDDRSQLVAATSVDFFQDLVDDIQGAQEELQRLNQVLTEKCGTDAQGYSLAPSTSDLVSALEKCRSRTLTLCKNVLTVPEPEVSAEDGVAVQDENNLVTVDPTKGDPIQRRVQSREEAFRVLEKVADYFRRTEPHSPICYQIERAVRWGRTPLEDLFEELIDDQNTREQVFRLMGIKTSDDSNEGN